MNLIRRHKDMGQAHALDGAMLALDGGTMARMQLGSQGYVLEGILEMKQEGC